MKTETIVILIADEGKTFMRVSDGEIIGTKISLGVNDDAENYKEVVEENNIEPFE